MTSRRTPKKSSRERIWAAASSVLANPVWSAIEAVLALITGLVGSLYSSELRCLMTALVPEPANSSSAPNADLDAAIASPGVCVFWSLLAATAVLYVVRSTVLGARARDAQHRLEDAVAKVEDEVSTNAPPDYLQALGMMYEKSRVLAQLATTAEERACSMGVALQSVAKLTRMYDIRSRNTDHVYAANIMWFISQEKAKSWDPHVAFRNEGTTLEGVRGVLALAVPYSATNDKIPDPKMRDFALDIPREFGSREKRWRALPGAPIAFSRRAFEYFHPAVSIREWFDTFGDFAPSTKGTVAEYFEQNAEIAGFMSLPLYVPSAEFREATERDVIGVLNIHWSGADMLATAKSARKFSETLYPFRVLLAEQMIKILSDGAIAPGSVQRTTSPA